MKNSLEHLPKRKREELERAVSVIREMCDDVEMIILFGSHARGNYKDEEDLAPDRKSGAVSDYDILVVSRLNATSIHYSLWRSISEHCNGLSTLMPFRIIVHDIKFIKKRLKERHFFYSDIVREGCLLYDSGRYKLNIGKELPPEQQIEIAKEHFDNWFNSAKAFYENYEYNIGKENTKQYLNNAAFQLHQAAESAYKAIELVFTNYIPNGHFLGAADRRIREVLPDLEVIFPCETEADKERFDLFEYAYIGARYDKDFKISRKDLEYFAGRVKLLLEVTAKRCKEKIESLKWL
ncbi:MAG: HEPN domain-containing protein [Victivallaceae bacterium]|nr:HEPN domain-containing protein [Victivallaceae bacterium]